MLERDEELLNSKQVAVILDLSPDTVNEFARKKILPAFKKGNSGDFANAIYRYFTKSKIRIFATLDIPPFASGVEKMAEIEAHESKIYSEFAPFTIKSSAKFFTTA